MAYAYGLSSSESLAHQLALIAMQMSLLGCDEAYRHIVSARTSLLDMLDSSESMEEHKQQPLVDQKFLTKTVTVVSLTIAP